MVVAFSVSFETDYVHVLDVLAAADLPLWREERVASAPLVIAGGPATFLNPEPLAEFVDLFLVGEGEEMLPEWLAAVRSARGGKIAGKVEVHHAAVKQRRPDNRVGRAGREHVRIELESAHQRAVDG